MMSGLALVERSWFAMLLAGDFGMGMDEFGPMHMGGMGPGGPMGPGTCAVPDYYMALCFVLITVDAATAMLDLAR